MPAKKNPPLLIQIAPWNDLYDPMREWKGLVEKPPYLDDTNKAGLFIEQHLKSLDHDVRRSMQRPPFSEEWLPRKPDLFIGIGVGNPIGITHHRREGMRECFGVETDYPMAWIGCTSLTSYPSYAYYRSFVRGLKGDAKYLEGEVSSPPHFHDLVGRENAMKNVTDQVLQWFWDTRGPLPIPEIVKIENEQKHDVFICYNSKSRHEVKPIVESLKASGIKCFLDTESVRPGTLHQNQIKPGMEYSGSIAIFFGEHGVGPWQSQEIQEAVGMAIASGKPVIPVILPSCQEVPALPFAIGNFSWVDMRDNPSEIDDLIWGITGRK